MSSRLGDRAGATQLRRQRDRCEVRSQRCCVVRSAVFGSVPPFGAARALRKATEPRARSHEEAFRAPGGLSPLDADANSRSDSANVLS